MASTKQVLELLRQSNYSASEIAVRLRSPVLTVKTRLAYLLKTRRIAVVHSSRRDRKWKVLVGPYERNHAKKHLHWIWQAWNALSPATPSTVTTISQQLGISRKSAVSVLLSLESLGQARNISNRATKSSWIQCGFSPKKVTWESNPIHALVTYVENNPGTIASDILHRWPHQTIAKTLKAGLLVESKEGISRRLYPTGYHNFQVKDIRLDQLNDLLNKLIIGPLPIWQVATDRASNQLAKTLVRDGYAEVLDGHLVGYGFASFRSGLVPASDAFNSFAAMSGTDSLEILAQSRPKLFRRVQRLSALNDNP